jgi:hypothetical protein
MKCHQSPEAPAWSLQKQEFYWQYKMTKGQAFSQDHPCLVPQLSVSTYLQNVSSKAIDYVLSFLSSFFSGKYNYNTRN